MPQSAFSYLTSHGSLDQEHIGTYEAIVNRLEDPADRAAVTHCAKAFYTLYTGLFASLPRATDEAGFTEERAVA